MSQFTTRVELHDAGYSDYVTLHEAMRKNGFSHKITSDDDVTYELPDAEYDITSSSRSNVLALAKSAAQSTGKSFGVLVTESNGRTWYGLSKV